MQVDLVVVLQMHKTLLLFYVITNLHELKVMDQSQSIHLQDLRSLIFYQNRGYPFMADILAGYDAEGPALFNIDMFGSVEKKHMLQLVAVWVAMVYRRRI